MSLRETVSGRAFPQLLYRALRHPRAAVGAVPAEVRGGGRSICREGCAVIFPGGMRGRAKHSRFERRGGPYGTTRECFAPTSGVRRLHGDLILHPVATSQFS